MDESLFNRKRLLWTKLRDSCSLFGLERFYSELEGIYNNGIIQCQKNKIVAKVAGGDLSPH